MTLTRKILIGLLVVLVVGLASLAIAFSHNAECEPAPPLAEGTPRMKAIVHRCYGTPEVLKLEEIEKPTPADNQILVRVHAASVNPYDWHFMTGTPYFMRIGAGIGRPKSTRAGVDFAGTVEAVGKDVTRFKAGDEVFGGAGGALAEYVRVREDRVALKPANVSFEQAAGVYIAALTALQGLRNEGGLQAGQKVLINGASGGVGTFAVQIAKALGAEVAGVCSTRNVEIVRSLGADRVFDYTREDFTESGERYDVILDNVGNRSFSELRRVLAPKGVYVMVSGPKTNKFFGPLGRALRAPIYSRFVDQKFGFFVSESSQEDLDLLRELMEAGKVKPVIDRQYSLSEAQEAMRYLGAGHARAKVVVKVVEDDSGVEPGG